MNSLPLSVSHFWAPALPSPGNTVLVHYPSPSITTPCAQVMMQFMGGVRLPYIATGAPSQVSFELRVYGGLSISWMVSLLPLFWCNAKIPRLYYNPTLFCTVKWMSLQRTVVVSVWRVKIDCNLSNFSSCARALCQVSHCPSCANKSGLFWQKWLRNQMQEQCCAAVLHTNSWAVIKLFTR